MENLGDRVNNNRKSRDKTKKIKIFLNDKSNTKKGPSEPKFMPIALWDFNFLSKMRILPMYWDPETTSFKRSPSTSWRMLHYYFAVICLLSEYAFMTVRFVQLITKNWPINRSSKLGEVIVLLSFMAAKSMAVASHLIFMFQNREIIHLTNQIIKMRKREQLVQDLPAVKVFTIAFIARSVQMFIVSYAKPNKTQFWWSILSARRKTWLVFAFHLLFNGVTASMFVSILYLLVLMLSYTHYLQVCFKKQYTRFCSVYKKLMEYRVLQILAIRFEVTCGAVAVPYITLYAFLMTVVLSFACIRYYDDLDFRVYMQMPLGLCMIGAFSVAFYSSVGSQPSQSREALKIRFEDYTVRGAGYRHMENKIYLKACKSIELFKIRRKFLPSLTRFVVFQTTRLLIVTSNK